MAAASPATKSVVLNSWKEIAAYLGRGVRTVQRYEHDLGLPVRRPRGTSRSAVIALTDELDTWLRTTPSNELRTEPKSPPTVITTSVRESIGEGTNLRSQCNALRAAHSEAVARLMTNLNGLVQEISVINSRLNKGNGNGSAT
jgi:hypothetical protein